MLTACLLGRRGALSARSYQFAYHPPSLACTTLMMTLVSFLRSGLYISGSTAIICIFSNAASSRIRVCLRLPSASYVRSVSPVFVRSA